MTDTRALIQRKLDTLRAREAAAKQLLAGQGRVRRKSPDKAAKLPETERAQLKLVAKWETLHKHYPNTYTQTKYERACARLANTQRQLAKLTLQPFAEELAQLHKEIVELERVLAVIDQVAAEYHRELWELLTERYAIDNITGSITLRATGGSVSSYSEIMVKGKRYTLQYVRQVLLTGGLV